MSGFGLDPAWLVVCVVSALVAFGLRSFFVLVAVSSAFVLSSSSLLIIRSLNCILEMYPREILRDVS